MECLHVGEPPSNFGSWESKTIYIHNFLDFPDTKSNDNVVYSPLFKCFSHSWELGVFPGGHEDAKDGYVTVDLCNKSNDKITVDFRIITVLKADGKKSVVGKREQKEPERKSTRKSIPVIEPPPKKRDKKTPAPVKEVDEEGQ